MANSRGRNWCLTLNNPAIPWRPEFTKLIDFPKFQYIIAQHEIGEKDNTPHIQAYIQFNNVIRFNALKKLIPRGHFEIAKGSSSDNQLYCSKDETSTNDRFEFGEPKHQGKRTDIHKAVERAAAGDKVSDIITDDPSMLKYRRHLHDHQTELLLDIRRPTTLTVEVHWGQSRAGKTYSLIARGDIFKPVRSASGHWWWDGYRGEKRVLFDDFYGNMAWSQLMQMLDPSQPFRGDVKGQMPLQVIADEYYFTSNVPPEKWYDWTNSNMKLEALLARITKIIEYERKGNWEPPKPIRIKRTVNRDYEFTDRPAVAPIFEPKSPRIRVRDRDVFTEGFVFGDD